MGSLIMYEDKLSKSKANDSKLKMINLKSDVLEAPEEGEDMMEHHLSFLSKHFGKYVRKLDKKDDKFRSKDDKVGGTKKDNKL